MPLPANQDTSADYNYFISQNPETQNHPSMIATAIVVKGDFIIINPGERRPLIGVAENSAAIGEEFQVDITEGIEIQTAQIEAGQTFINKHADVWFNNATGEISEVETAGYFLIGNVQIVEDADHVVRFIKRRYAILGEAT